jgi:DNA-binding transcriptional regulator YdaS (Cro superfamily)
MTLPEWIAAHSQRRLAAELGVDQSLVSRWLRRRVPADRIAAVAAVTGLTPSEIRPDLAALFGDQQQPEEITPLAVSASNGTSHNARVIGPERQA